MGFQSTIKVLILGVILNSNCVQPLEAYTYSNSEKQFELVNGLDECMVFILNFQGLDIPFDQISVPVILIRYFSFLGDFFVYPFELISQHHIKTSELYENINDIWETLVERNMSSVLNDEKGKDYVNFPFNLELRLANKNTNCEAKVYLHPPNEEVSSYMYYEHRRWGSILKDPFHIKFGVYDDEFSKMINHYISNNAKYSLLICNNIPESICINNNDTNKWLIVATRPREGVTTSEVLLIQHENEDGHHFLELFCQYCHPCDPFKRVSVDILESNINSIFKKLAYYIASVLPKFIGIVAAYPPQSYKNILSEENRTRKALLENLPDFETEFFPRLMDLHAFDMIILENISLVFLDEFEELYESRTVLKSECSLSRANSYPGKFISSIERNNEIHIGFYQELGLFFQTTQLRFVSCHREQKHWINQLQELVLAFDLWTWGLIFISCLIIAYLHTLTTRSNEKYNRPNFCDSCFCLYVSIVDQSTQIFSRSDGSKLLLCVLPLAFLILSNEYKGDNITRLTLDPSLVPFDTFQSLLDYKFKIYSGRVHLSEEAYSTLKENTEIEADYLQESGHEAFPIVSELWFQVLLRFALSQWNRLSNLKGDISEKTFWYFNNSQMVPRWKQDSGHYEAVKSSKDLLNKHIKTCHKSAVLLMQNSAIQMYTKLAASNKPVYMGKDILTENLLGYRYDGYFPSKLLSRIKYSSHMGIHNWWQQYYKWYLALQTHIDIHVQANVNNRSEFDNSNKSNSAVYILSLFLCISLTISLLSFVIFDSHVLKNTFNCLWVTFHMPTSYVSKQPESIKEIKESCSTTCRQFDKVSCPFCPTSQFSTTFEHMESYKFHLSISHTDHFFMDILETHENLESLNNLCNIVLSSEISTIVPVGQCKHMQYKCPYCDDETLLKGKILLRLHLLESHHDILLEKIQSLKDIK